VSKKLMFALIAGAAGTVWLILATLFAASFGDHLRLNLGWDGGGAGTVGIVLWIGLVVGVPATVLVVYSSLSDEDDR